MFDRQSLHVALLLWGCVFCMIAALCMLVSRNFERRKRLWLLGMQLSCAILLLSDALAWGFRGVPGIAAGWTVRISNYLVFTFSDIVLLLFHSYVCETACLERTVRRGQKCASRPDTPFLLLPSR